MTRKMFLTDKNNTAAEIDDLLGALVLIDVPHHMIHKGLMYQADHINLSVADDASIEILVKVGANEGAHMRFSASAGGDAHMFLFENPTISADGTTLTANNRNRRSSNTADVSVFHTPTISADGAQISERFVPGGSGFLLSTGDTEGSFEEWILSDDEDYLFRITNVAGTNQPLAIALDWYEPGPPVVST